MSLPRKLASDLWPFVVIVIMSCGVSLYVKGWRAALITFGLSLVGWLIGVSSGIFIFKFISKE